MNPSLPSYPGEVVRQGGEPVGLQDPHAPRKVRDTAQGDVISAVGETKAIRALSLNANDVTELTVPVWVCAEDK